MEETLAGLGSRVFLMNNVHEDEPVVFHTRWVLSYLRGPLTRGQIKSLMDPRKAAAARQAPAPAAQPAKIKQTAAQTPSRPALPSRIPQQFLLSQQLPPRDRRLVYRPALCGTAKLHFVRASYKIDVWVERALFSLLQSKHVQAPWKNAVDVMPAWDLDGQPEEAFGFADVPAELRSQSSFAKWEKQFKTYLYQSQTVGAWKCSVLKLYSEAGELEGDFRARLSQRCKEQRDLQVEKLRNRYGSKLATLRDRIRAAEQRVDRETEQYRKASFNSVVKIGSSLMGALFGRKLMSRTNISKASTSVRSLGSAAEQRGDIGRAKEKLEAYQEQLEEMERQFDSDVAELELEYDVEALELESLELRPRKSDIQVEAISVVWTP